ncbi:MAG: DNA polymerase domain-containing protein [Acidobacteriota bacterium]
MDALLFGHNEETHVVALHPVGGSAIRIYTRAGARIESVDRDYFPFFHCSDSRFIEGFPRKFWLRKLEGAGFYQYLCVFQSSFDAWDAVQHALRRINAYYHTSVSSYLDTEHLLFRPDMTTQYLLQSGMTLFKGMDAAELYRMQIDVQAVSAGRRWPNAERRDDRIVFIALSDSRGWQKVLGSKRTSERKLLEDFIETVRTKDPDVIEGHNCYGGILPYLMARCRLHGIECALGRDGTAPSSCRTQTMFGESSIEYTSYEIAGRHIIDTWLLAQQHDARRTLEHYGLRQCAQHFGVGTPNRLHIPDERISWSWEHEPEALAAFASENVVETRALSDALFPPLFYLAQMLPFNFGTLAKLGQAAKIESILLRAYLRRRHSLPKPRHGTQNNGPWCELFATGVFGPVVHVEIESLYPSLMLMHDLRPAPDALNVFLAALRYLTERGAELRRFMLQASDASARRQAEAMHASFTALINSFYGYLSYAKALFNDYDKADEAAALGEEVLRGLVRDITLHNGMVLEADTDSVFFVPPDNASGEKNEAELAARLSSGRPAGITLALSGRYAKMLCFRKKNYALLSYDDKVKLKGQALMPRGAERFARVFMQQTIECLLSGKFADIHTLYNELVHSLLLHEMNVTDFLKTETLRESPDDYEAEVAAGTRNRSAVYEAVLQTRRLVRPGEKISFYVTGKDPSVSLLKNVKEAHLWDENFPDENTAYYLRRLDECAEKFAVFFQEKDFKKIFTSDDLFGFDAAGVAILNKRIVPAGEAPPSYAPIELDRQ